MIETLPGSSRAATREIVKRMLAKISHPEPLPQRMQRVRIPDRGHDRYEMICPVCPPIRGTWHPGITSAEINVTVPPVAMFRQPLIVEDWLRIDVFFGFCHGCLTVFWD
jgi:hypothetical protein